MAIFGSNLVFIFCITIVTLSGIKCQVGISQISALLGSVNDTTTNMSSILPHIQSVLTTQEDLQTVTNLLLANNTFAAFKMVQILQETSDQNPMISFVHNQQQNHEETKRILQNQQETETQMATTQSQIAQTLTQKATTQTQMKQTQSQMKETQTQIAASQNQTVTLLQNQQVKSSEIVTLLQNQQNTMNQLAATQTQMQQTQSLMKQTQTQTSTSQNQMVNLLQTQQVKSNEIVSLLQNQQDTLNQMAAIQTLMYNAYNQVINLLQTQSQQLHNMTTVMNNTMLALTYQGTLLQGNPRDCTDLRRRGNYPSGPYTITPWDGLDYDVDVYCDMDTDGGGWTVFQRRFDGTGSFYRSWYNYENGFGVSYDEFWAGLRMLHLLTSSGIWELRVDLEDYDGNTAYAVYDSFRIGDAKSNYTLSVANYHGTAGDSLSYSNNKQFSTYDRENNSVSRNCALQRHGAWWYHSCSWSNLNGPYFALSSDEGASMHWYHWQSSRESLRMSEMKIRRARSWVPSLPVRSP